jgi:dipeptidyl aminopeptidase/acylaminoacyl peptidase
VNEDRLKRLLAEQPLPDETAAMERGWRVVSATVDEPGPRPVRRRRMFGRFALAAAALCALVAAAFTPPGEAVADWIEDVVRPAAETSSPPLRLPSDGRLLVNTPAGPWIVQQDGSKRLLGNYEDASWSPAGLFVAATRGRQLFAVEPGGRVRWSVDASQAVSGARWAPSGFRIAYLAGAERAALYVVAADGTQDRRLHTGVADVPPAWRPGLTHVIAYSDRHGGVVVVNADTRKELWHTAPGPTISQLAWSEDGQRLVALSRTALRIFDAEGQFLSAVPIRLREPQALPTYVRDVAFARRGHRFALIRATRSGTGSEVVTLAAEGRPGSPRPVFSAPGAIGEIEWSPDGQWLLVAWTGADQWVFVRPAPSREVRTVVELAGRFDAGSGPELPNVSGWCCPSVRAR